MIDTSFIDKYILSYNILDREDSILLYKECVNLNVTPEFFLLSCKALTKDSILKLNQAKKTGVKLPEQDVLSLFHINILKSEIEKIKTDSLDSKMPAYPKIEEEIDKFVIKDVLGKGATSMVYKAYHKYLNMNVALKVLSPQLILEDSSIQEKFLNEAMTSAKLSHPNIVKILDANRIKKYTYIVMEYIEGFTLEEIITKVGYIDPAKAIKIGLEVSSVLEYALKQFNLIHRDIKPGNIMVTKKSEIKLADFGLAKIVNEPDMYQTISGEIYGTPYYMSPEQIIDYNHVDHRSDMYSLGATLYYLVTGKVPFESKNLAQIIFMQINQKPIPPVISSSNVSQNFSNVIMKLLEKDLKSRYQDYTELTHALRLAAQEYISSNKIIKMRDAVGM